MQLKAFFLYALCVALFASLLALSSHLDFQIYSFLSLQRNLHEAPLWISVFTTAFIALIPILLFSRITQMHILAGILAYIGCAVLFLVLFIFVFKIWLPPVKVLLATFISYLFWSAFRDKAMQSSIDQALHAMRAELIHLGMEPEEDLSCGSNDSKQTRVSKLMMTMQHLRDLHKSRNDALMFISHDIRTPLGVATMLLDKFEKNKYTDRMYQLLARASEMAEGFVHASRAESADVNKFKVIDVVGVTQQAIDDLYELANVKQLTLQTDFSNDSICVRGDFGLLFRAISNVLLNAVNHAPNNSIVKISLSSDAFSLVLKVADQGPGIPEDHIPKLFKRFSRVDEEYQSLKGYGLGLYFVNITVKKHRGSVAVVNLPNQGAEFLIKLPLERRRVSVQVQHERRADGAFVLGDTA